MAKVAFIQNLRFEYLGTMYLSAILEKHSHRTDVFFWPKRDPRELNSEIDAFGPDIIGIYCVTGMLGWAKKAAAHLKARYPKAIIVLGGPLPTFSPQVIEQGDFDIICRGEGENALLKLAEKVDKNESYFHTPNLWVKNSRDIIKNNIENLIEDIDEIPFPNRDLYLKKDPSLDRNTKLFMTKRGCPFSCTYCYNNAFKELYADKGPVVRHRSPLNIIEEIKEAKGRYRLRVAFFLDSNFGLDKEWALTFLDMYKRKVNLPFICVSRIDAIDEEFVSCLKKAGCLNVALGIETGSDKLRNTLLKKNVPNDEIYRKAKLLRDNKVKFLTYNMFGIPGESLADAFETVKLNKKIKTNYPRSSIFQPYPGTEIYEHILRGNMLSSSKVFEVKPSIFRASPLNMKDIRKIENLHKLFFYAVKFPFLFPVIRLAVKINLGFIYDFLYLASYVYLYKMGEGLSWLEMFKTSLDYLRPGPKRALAR